jgi:trans-2,3-dihydro-3-hydroxyanthranilate isomerase
VVVRLKFYIVDVFAESKYRGNQLAVLIPDRPINQSEMQQIAREINFSEITFIMPGLGEKGGYDVKIFMPDSEIPFAGHPTIGTAYVIQRFLEDGKNHEIKLNLKVGQVPVFFDEQTVWMTQNPPAFGPEIDIESIAGALQISTSDINTDFPVQMVSTGLPSIIVNLKTLDAVKRCKISHLAYAELLEKVGNANILVFTTETVNPENDLHARVFMFSTGYLEDPATGSANGNLAGYLLEYNVLTSQKISYRVEQGYSIGRESLIQVKAQKMDGQFSIQVGGRVFVVAEGKWF